jgi:threonine dehydratase
MASRYQLVAIVGSGSIYQKSLEAIKMISSYIHRTPVDKSTTFSKMFGGEVYLKYENLQKSGSFKARGALYKIGELVSQGVREVVAASSGNHAQGVAYAASIYGVEATIYMPETASIAKIEATKSYGAKVVLKGRLFDEAYREALRYSEERGVPLVHAFNDLDIIAGQGTISLELMEQLGEFDLILVPVGGGGLISGIASVLKEAGRRVRVIGVEPEAAPKFFESLRAGRIADVEVRPSLADGLLAKRPGDITFDLVRRYVDEIVTVSEDSIARAVYLLMQRNKVIAEGAGAVGLAALLEGKVDIRGKRCVIVISGGNVDLTDLYRIIVRGLTAEGRMVELSIELIDAPGELKRVLEVIYEYRGNIVEITHRRGGREIPPGRAVVDLLIEVPTRDIGSAMVKKLVEKGYKVF